VCRYSIIQHNLRGRFLVAHFVYKVSQLEKIFDDLKQSLLPRCDLIDGILCSCSFTFVLAGASFCVCISVLKVLFCFFAFGCQCQYS